MVAWSWVEATKVIHTGKAMTSTPSSTMRWLNAVSQGRFSTMSVWPSVVHPALDEAELHDGQQDHDDHQDHRLGRRAAEVLATEAVVPHLVDQDVGRLPRPALGQRGDHTE